MGLRTTNTKLPAAYIHVPFCRHRCGYCNFTLVAGRDDLTESYLVAVERELSELHTRRDVSTIFIGGGTPTHLPPGALSRLLSLVRNWFAIAPNAEFSVEANPSDITPEKVNILTDAGVSRVSLGSQSFNSAKLKRLERDHDSATICKSCDLVREQISNVSLDLIFAAPHETLAEWEQDLAAAIKIDPNHISTYGLTIERGTMFWNRQLHRELNIVDDETQRAMYELAMDRLAVAGFEHYEVSNFVKPGFRSRHNENYWLGGQYYAVGPGAARYINGERSTNHQSTTTYINRLRDGDSPVTESEIVDAEGAARERLVFGLRRLEGIDCAAFAFETGWTIDQLVGESLADFIHAGLLIRKDDRLRLTRDGLIVSDSIWPSFL